MARSGSSGAAAASSRADVELERSHDFTYMLHESDLSQIDLNLLVLFEAVMAERHVARTAKRMHVSPSAVSHGFARLRRTLHDA